MHFIFGKIWPFLGQNPNIFWTGNKSFGTHIIENEIGTSILLFFGLAQDQKGKYLAQNDQICQFLDKFGRFGAKNPTFLRGEAKYLVPS